MFLSESLTWWLGYSGLMSLAILVLGSGAALLCRQPARKLRVIELSLMACLLTPLLGMVPGYPRLAIAWQKSEPIELQETATLSSVEPAEVSVAAPRFEVPQQPDVEPQALQRATEVPSTATIEPAVVPVRDLGEASTVKETPAFEEASTVKETPSFEEASARDWHICTWLAGLYLFGLVLGTAWWLLGIVALMRIVWTAQAASPRCQQLFAQIAGPRGERVKLLTSRLARQPFASLGAMVLPCSHGLTWGRSFIVIPESLCDDDQAVRWALAHEWTHIEQGHFRAWFVAGLTRVLFFYQPIVWWLRRQLRLCQDYVADAQASLQASQPEDYAEFLAVRAAAGSLPPAMAGLGMGFTRGKSELYRRVVMLVQNRPLESRPPRRWTLAITCITLFFAGILATLSQAKTEVAVAQPLREAVAAFNEKASNDAIGATQPPLTEAEVISAIRGWDRTRIKVNDKAYAVFQKIADSESLPPGATLDFITRWTGYKGYDFTVWWINLNVKTGKHAGYTFRIRDQKISVEATDSTTSKPAALTISPKAANETKSISPNSAAATFVAKLPDGITVELLGISTHPSNVKSWWRPDGSPLTEPPCDTLKGTVNGSANSVVREFAVQLHGLPKDAVGSQIKFKPSCDLFAGANPKRQGKTVPGLKAATVSLPNQPTVTVRVAVAAGPWQTVFENKGEPCSIGTPNGTFAVSPITEKDGNVNISIACNIIGPQTRLIAVGRDGREHTAGHTSQGGGTGFRQISVTFFKVSLKDIQTFRLQTRPYKWIEFRNVSLQPGQETNIQIASAKVPANAKKTSAPPQKKTKPAIIKEGLGFLTMHDEACPDDEIDKLIAQKKYKFIKTFDSPGGETQYIYRFTYPDGSPMTMNFSMRLEDVTSWDDYVKKLDVQRKLREERISQALTAGRFRLLNMEVIQIHICRDVASGEKFKVQRIVLPGGKDIAIPRMDYKVIPSLMKQTSWKKHLQAIRDGKRELLELETVNNYTYEMTADDGTKVTFNYGGNKPLTAIIEEKSKTKSDQKDVDKPKQKPTEKNRYYSVYTGKSGEQIVGIQPLDLLTIRALGTLIGEPIDGLYLVEPSGQVTLGPTYGRVNLKGLAIEAAEAAVRKQLKKTLARPEVQVTAAGHVSQWRSGQVPVAPHHIRPDNLLQIHVSDTLLDHPIEGNYTVEPTGTVPLGPAYGRVNVKGLTLEQAEAAIKKHLETILVKPLASVTLAGWKSDEQLKADVEAVAAKRDRQRKEAEQRAKDREQKKSSKSGSTRKTTGRSSKGTNIFVHTGKSGEQIVGVRPKGNCSIGGTVVDEDGKPVKNARMYLHYNVTHGSIFVNTDSKGHFEFKDIPTGPFSLTVSLSRGYQDSPYNPDGKPGPFPLFSLDEDEHRSDVVIKVKKAYRISGKLICEGGKRPKNFDTYTVLAWAKSGSGYHTRHALLNHRTGTYTIDGLDGKPVYVMAINWQAAQKGTAWPAIYYPSTFSRAEAKQVVFDKSRNVGNVDITLRKEGGIVLEGTVRDKKGNPVPEAFVVAHHQDMCFDYSTAYTDEKGHYRIEGLGPGSLQVHVDAAHRGFVRTRMPLELGEDTKQKKLDFTLNPGVTISGKFVNEKGKAWRIGTSYAYAWNVSEDRPARTTRQLNEGDFSLTNFQNKFRLKNSASHFPGTFLNDEGDYDCDQAIFPTAKTFLIQGVMPGHTMIGLSTNKEKQKVVKILYNGRDILESGIDTQPGQKIEDVTIVVGKE